MKKQYIIPEMETYMMKAAVLSSTSDTLNKDGETDNINDLLGRGFNGYDEDDE